jgi:hypothetical protein
VIRVRKYLREHPISRNDDYRHLDTLAVETSFGRKR